MFERQSSLHLFVMRMGKRTVRSQACLHMGVPEASIHQALTLSGGLPGRGQLTDALDTLHANHKKVTTVLFLPICLGSRGRKRIMILQETEKKMSSAPGLMPHIPRPRDRHSHHGLPGQPTLAPGHFASLPHPINVRDDGDCTSSSPSQDRLSTWQPPRSLYAICGFTEKPSLFQTAGPLGTYAVLQPPVFTKSGSRRPSTG